MEATVRKRRAPHSITHYWGMVKNLEDSQKLELVTMLIDSVRLRSSPNDEEERERGFRSLAGCWANDHDDDDMEAIIREGRESRRGGRVIPSFDE